jgi:hypothetical protein
VSRARSPCRRCRPNTGPVSQLAGTSCRSLALPSASRVRHQRARAASTCRPPRRDTPCRLEAPSTDRSREPPPALTHRASPADRHRCSDVSVASPASDMRSRPAPPSARPKPLAGSRRSVWATCRLPTSAAECSPSTPTGCPGLGHDDSGEPLPTKWRDPLRDPPAGFPQVRGLLGISPPRPPPRRPLVAMDLPQPDWPGHPLSRLRARHRLKAQRWLATVR